MPPTGPRADARARAEAALRLKCRGRTWQEIADELGFKSRSSALHAVKRLMLREPPEDVLAARTFTTGAYRQVTAALFDSLEAAKKAQDHEAVVSISRAIAYVQDKNARLTGQQIPVAQEVDVNVQVHSTTHAVIDQAERDLLAIVGGRQGQLPVLDAELVDAP
ncbi:Uncharacterised protein [Mycolicibacterium vanbaalenii]|uniref:Uncharacterized protein n=1 Tax=Mycolicibacterium vanbaalenii TaxID=110539 RepID=A0A5S9R9G5_MYCVN|nr:hypothetical protein [Mycolicibacterium vanbaalenii]CAA0136336.1 Uncharacterised protein [Mycolicibacterium vanbaalenii]